MQLLLDRRLFFPYELPEEGTGVRLPRPRPVENVPQLGDGELRGLTEHLFEVPVVKEGVANRLDEVGPFGGRVLLVFQKEMQVVVK